MSWDQDRGRGYEAQFAHDEEMKFRIAARRNRLLGEWAARKMGLSEVETESYAKDVVRSDFEEAGEHDVIRKVLGDLTAAGVDCDEEKVVEALRNKEIEARRQIIEASRAPADLLQYVCQRSAAAAAAPAIDERCPFARLVARRRRHPGHIGIQLPPARTRSAGS